MAKKRKLALFRGDRSLWIIIAVLCVVSMLVVYSATASMAYREVAGDTSHYLFRQFRFIVLGFFIIMVVHWIDYKSYAKYARVLFNVSVVLVILAYVVGVSLNEAPRWLRVPVIGLTFQPSDLLKITLVMVLAQQLGARQEIIDRIPILPSFSYGAWKRNPHKNLDIFMKTTKPLILPIVVACAVVLPANLSTSLILFAVSMVILVVGRVRRREIARLVMVAVFSLVVVVGVMKVFDIGRANVWVSRVTTYVAPLVSGADGAQKDDDDDFQIEQARIAIASGGVFGKGPGNSTQRSQLPHPYSDFAYAFIVEEYGIFGASVVFVLYLWIFYRAGVVVRRCNRPSAALMVLGLALSITSQAFVNMAVSVGLLPVTGQTLPLISLGGSSVFFTCIAFGMILGISRESDEYEARVEELARVAALAESQGEGDLDSDFNSGSGSDSVDDAQKGDFEDDFDDDFDEDDSDSDDSLNDSDDFDDSRDSEDDLDDDFDDDSTGNPAVNSVKKAVNEYPEDDELFLVDYSEPEPPQYKNEEKEVVSLYDDDQQ